MINQFSTIDQFNALGGVLDVRLDDFFASTSAVQPTRAVHFLNLYYMNLG